MSLPLRLRRAARAEFDEAADWYETRRRGLGMRFVTSVRIVLDAIAVQPDRYPEVWPSIREALVSGWPYGIYYQVHADHVMVLAIFHAARDPSQWQARA